MRVWIEEDGIYADTGGWDSYLYYTAEEAENAARQFLSAVAEWRRRESALAAARAECAGDE